MLQHSSPHSPIQPPSFSLSTFIFASFTHSTFIASSCTYSTFIFSSFTHSTFIFSSFTHSTFISLSFTHSTFISSFNYTSFIFLSFYLHNSHLLIIHLLYKTVFISNLYIILHTFSSYINKLQRVQNLAARLALNDWHSPSHVLVSKLHWLPVLSRIKFTISSLTYKLLNDHQPGYLSSLISPYYYYYYYYYYCT